MLTLDTETTADECQTLRFGSCSVHIDGSLTEFFLFYNDTPGVVNDEEKQILQKYAEEHQVKDLDQTQPIELMTKTEFVEEILTRYCYRSGALLVCFNVPFDVSRLAIGYGKAIKKNLGGFSLKLSDDPAIPRITLKHLDSTKSFTNYQSSSEDFFEFMKPSHRRLSRKKHANNPGRFLDLKTLTFALTNKHFDLKHALEAFGCRPKDEAEQHGIIDPKYIAYNINDTLVTHELYLKALERYRLYHLDKDASQIYSPASIGKAYLQQMGVTPFLDKNPDFDKKILGYLMTAYYGARVEVKHRLDPVKITDLDFTSMYPSLYVLLGLDHYLKTNKIIHDYNTKDVQQFLNDVTLDELKKKDTWKKLISICRLSPNNDVLPVRADYSGKGSYNISLCHIERSDTGLWYSLSDLVASKLLTGKAPIIEEAITFTPDEKMQPGLKPITIFGNIDVPPEEDFIKLLIEKRQRIKIEMNNIIDQASSEYLQLDLQQNVLKIIANSTAYGIFIELTTEKLSNKKKNKKLAVSQSSKGDQITIYGLKTITSKLINRIETPGPMFNPIMGVTITAGAKLILAMAETILKEDNGEIFYCDTDSVLLAPKNMKKLQTEFQSLNPYDTKDLKMFKVEREKKQDGTDGEELKDIWFYGISDKRYCLYDYNPDLNEYTIRKASLHGLGHMLTNDEKETWTKQVWVDILTVHYHREKRDGIKRRYDRQVCAYEQSITSYDIWKRFDYYNQGKPIEKQVKPFNFLLRGVGCMPDPDTGEIINPAMPYINYKDPRFRYIRQLPFFDPKTLKEYKNDTAGYWKTMGEYLFDRHGYADHPEYKLDGAKGKLERKHVSITKDMLVHIGKESNNWESRKVEGTNRGDYIIIDDPTRFNDDILKMSQREMLEKGIDPRTGSKTKKRIRETGTPGRRSKIRSDLAKRTRKQTK